LRVFEPRGCPNKAEASFSLATAGEIGLPQLPIVKAVRDVFKTLYDQGHERWDHSAFLLHLEKLNAPARLGDKADTPPQS
jgi:hypothetical protein